MNKDYPDNSESNISNTEISGSFSLDGIKDISATFKHGTSILKLKPNKSYLIKIEGGNFAIVRVFKDGSIRYVIHDDYGISEGEL